MKSHSILIMVFVIMGLVFTSNATQDQKQLIDDIKNSKIKCGIFELDTVVRKTAQTCLDPYFKSKEKSSVVNIFLSYKYYDVAARHAKKFAEANGFDLLIDKSELNVIYAKDSVDKSLKKKSGRYSSMAIRKLFDLGIVNTSLEIVDFLCSEQDSSFRKEAETKMDQYLKK